ncbi:hypothetical protein AOL_s00112g20 [Orbilia oligospora ATCC 24927]|uniref:Uncharacterized protein n=1 Tax=Arthrobotrys oligospora (strain ATCC 24927 / CBS 115.81 / DSM 1491) TaxID=756982 RepID=G1XLJ0_ARTOA|nr:hypothetical protein AOL_s00112g20 [Orbilia oligospora ATCC 24927]EGX46003.1 hypothetical protein AOL_s00112g20 [Orbilia oligospora ATCC 24927]
MSAKQRNVEMDGKNLVPVGVTRLDKYNVDKCKKVEGPGSRTHVYFQHASNVNVARDYITKAIEDRA